MRQCLEQSRCTFPSCRCPGNGQKLVWRNSLTDEPLEDELDIPEDPQERSYEEEIRLRVLDDQQPY